MAKARKTAKPKIKAIGKRATGRYVPPMRPDPRPDPTPAQTSDTRESLIAEMDALLTEVDTVLPTIAGSINWAYPWGKLEKERKLCDDLNSRMWRVIRDEDTPFEDKENSFDVFIKALAAKPGTDPTPARPGNFIVWLGFVPVGVYWGGFLNRVSMGMYAVDPAAPWFYDTGYCSAPIDMPNGKGSPRIIARNFLAKVVAQRKFKLLDLNADGRERAAERMKEEPWIQAVLAAGPVDTMRLPANISVQTKLFA